jgi:hypothetical protein
LDFHKLTVDDKRDVTKYMEAYGGCSCQHSFASMFCFDNKYGHLICERDGVLFVRREKLSCDGYAAYLMPFGSGDLTCAVTLLLEDAHADGRLVRFNTVTEAAKDFLLTGFPSVFEAIEVRGCAEYIYSYEKLALLNGSALASQRHDVNAFWRAYGGRVLIRDITQDDSNEILEYQTRWLRTRLREEDTVQLEQEHEAITRGLTHFDALGLCGIMLYVDGVLRGYAYGAKLSDSCYDVMIEKGDREINDIYRVLNMETVKRCCEGTAFINREEDLDVPGLRKAKLSYKPDILMKKYVVSEMRR